MRAGMAGADGVFHVAGWYKVGARDRSAAEAVNVTGTRNVLELMRDLAIPRGVYTSTVAVFGDTRGRVVDETYRFNGPFANEYERTKWLAHYTVAEPMMGDGLPLVTVQPGLVYGPGDAGPMHDTIVRYLRRRLPAVPEGTSYSWGHVEDTARGHILAMEKGRTGETYIIAGPPHTIIEVLKMSEAISGVKVPRLRPSPGILRSAASVMEMVEKVLPVPWVFRAEVLRAATVSWLGTSAKAERELGFRARSLAEGWPETLRYKMRQLGMDGST